MENDMNQSKRTGLSALARVLLAAMFIVSGCAAQTAKKQEPRSRSAGQPAWDQKEASETKTPKFPKDTVIHFEAKQRTVILAKAENLTEAFSDDDHFKALQKENRFEDIALKFVNHFRKNFKIDAPTGELKVSSVKTDDLGLTHVRFRQTFSGIPVRACEITVHLNADNNVYMVQGRYIPTPRDAATRPRLDRREAFGAAARDLEGKTGGCSNCEAELVIYPDSSEGPRLAWEVRSSSGLAEKWTHLIDAKTGEILKKESGIRTKQ